MASTKRRQKANLSLKLNLALILALALLFSWSIMLVKDKLLSNANDMATHLAESYAAEEEGRLSSYEAFLSIAAYSVDDQLARGDDDASIAAWLNSYSAHLSDMLGADVLDPYAIIDGHVVAATHRDGDESLDYTAAPWYQKALEANGGVVFTDAYQDALSGETVASLSVKLTGEGNVLAFDIALDSLRADLDRASMPEGSSYFLMDGTGRLIYSDSGLDTSQPDAQNYLNTLLQGIQDGSLADHMSYITDMEGVNRGVYYTAMDNGWFSVITIPLENILQEGWDMAVVVLAGVSLALVALIVVVTVREHLRNRRIEHTAETLRILGDTFYAIHRVNLATGTYETIKSPPDVRNALRKGNSYDYLLKTMSNVVEAETYALFEDSFSLENIWRLSNEGVDEFGGDYRRRFGNTYKWVSAKVTFSDELGRDEVIISFREIDEEKRRQKQHQELLESALSSAKQAAERKNDFFSKVSHDLRTPLNAIIGLSDLALREPNDTELARRNLERIAQSGRQMLTLVNDVLDMSRIEQGEGSLLDLAPMDIEKCVRDSATLFEVSAQKDGKDLAVDVDVDHLCVMGDAFRLGQIMNNLISNAVKYTLPGGSISVRVREVSTGTVSNKYQITVADDGIGMSESFLDHIFEPFARETMFTTQRIVGTGLGMPIVKSLVQQMSGEITVKSAPGEGSTFTITLPLKPVEPETPPAQDKNEKQPPDLTGMTILVAEDNEINMEITQTYLDMLGAKSIPAWNGAEAVRIFASIEPGGINAVLMDMQMPEMDGCAACEAIRALDRPDAKTVPVIAVTANAFAEDISRTTKAGMNGHVPKPIDFATLAEVLSSALGK